MAPVLGRGVHGLCRPGPRSCPHPYPQVFQTASEKLEAECLGTLTALAACLSHAVLHADTHDPLDTFLSGVLQGNCPGCMADAGASLGKGLTRCDALHRVGRGRAELSLALWP